jgi:hypothetical protein
MSPPDIFYSGVDFPLLDPANRMEWLAFYMGLVLLIGLLLRYYSIYGFSNISISGFQEKQPEQAPEPTTFKSVYKPESWCLLSETVLGRTCVRSEACAPTARYPSHEACTLTDASALPLGIAHLDQYYRPFMAPLTQQKTTF